MARTNKNKTAPRPHIGEVITFVQHGSERVFDGKGRYLGTAPVGRAIVHTPGHILKLRMSDLDMIEQVADAHSLEALKPTGLHQQTAHEQISRSVRLAYTTETPTKQTKPSAPRRFRVRTSRSDYVAMPSEREHPLGLVRPAFC